MRERRNSIEKETAYRVEVFFDPAEGAWFARYPELPGCLAHGNTMTAALKSGERAKKLWLDTAREHGDKIPPPARQLEASGKFVLRLPKGLHQDATERAAQEGVSLNTFLVQATAEAVQRSGFRNLARFFERILPRALRSVLGASEGQPPHALHLMVGLRAVFGDEQNPKTERELEQGDESIEPSRGESP